MLEHSALALASNANTYVHERKNTREMYEKQAFIRYVIKIATNTFNQAMNYKTSVIYVKLASSTCFAIAQKFLNLCKRKKNVFGIKYIE